MGLWDTVGKVGKVAKSAMDKMESFNDEVQDLISDYSNKDDDFLKRKLSSGSFAQKSAATKVLKERGYGSNY